MKRPMRWILSALLALLAVAPLTHGEWGGWRGGDGEFKPEEHWFVVEMQGQRCGHMHAQTAKDGERFISTSEMRLEIKRGQIRMPITIATEFVETAAGKPVRMKSETKLGALPTIEEYLFKPDGVEVTHIGTGYRNVEHKPLPEGEWLTPMGMERAIAAKIAEGAKEIAVRSIEPSSGLKPATTTMTLLERAPLDVIGKTVPSIKWKAKNEFVPAADSIEYTDEQGAPLRSETSIGLVKIILIRADRALALSKADPPELLESTFIKPDKQIPNARESKKASFLVRSGDAPIGTWPTAGVQTATVVNEHAVRIVTDAAGFSVCTKSDIESDEFRKPSSMINSDDAKVKELAEGVVKKLDRAVDVVRAEAMRKFVYQYITKKTFDVGFGTAAETARTRCGDCTEHAVLLCAMLRANNIPARCVSGLVYADGIAKDGTGALGYHMWTQAMVEDRRNGEVGGMKWIDLDAALSMDHPVDATHLAIRTLGLADGQTMNDLMDILPTLGKLKITVEKAE
jgi:transglutaminase-like putative cysteine protease